VKRASAVRLTGREAGSNGSISTIQPILWRSFGSVSKRKRGSSRSRVNGADKFVPRDNQNVTAYCLNRMFPVRRGLIGWVSGFGLMAPGARTFQIAQRVRGHKPWRAIGGAEHQLPRHLGPPCLEATL